MTLKNVKAHLPHDKLSSKIWDDNKKMLPEVREALIRISNEFVEYLGIDIDVVDVTMTGSYANYNYTPFSDIDLHILVDFNSVNDDLDLVEQFFNAKKSFWNDRHDIELRGIEVEMYPQKDDEPHASSGVYSVTEDEWVVEPKKFRTEFDLEFVNKKSEKLKKEIILSIREAEEENSLESIDRMLKKLKNMRKAGLEKSGEMSDENIVYKVIRSLGLLQALFDAKSNITDKNLSLA